MACHARIKAFKQLANALRLYTATAMVRNKHICVAFNNLTIDHLAHFARKRAALFKPRFHQAIKIVFACFHKICEAACFVVIVVLQLQTDVVVVQTSYNKSNGIGHFNGIV